MAPLSPTQLESLTANPKIHSDGPNKHSIKDYKIEIVWRNVTAMIVLHSLAIWGFILVLRGHGMFNTFAFNMCLGVMSGFGITAGAHRLWCHRSYKAKVPLRVILAILQTMALQNDIYEWCRDHRVHHKYSETDADPHNSNRGFFFAHMGWLFCKKHPEVREKGKHVDLSDLWADPIVRIQQRIYIPLVILLWGIIPIYIPIYCWGESLKFAICFNMLRYVMSLHNTWLVNSAAHIYGHQPYDKTIRPKENTSVVYLALGEGYHNYHHTFPWDYSTSEFGWRYNFNPSTAFIDLFATIGWAYDLKTASYEIIQKRKERTGEKGIKTFTTMAVIIDFILGITLFFWPLILASSVNIYRNYL